jgi:predicted MFS family arabinose efflux permease
MRFTQEADPTEEFKMSDVKNLLTNTSFIYTALLCVTFCSAAFPFLKFAPDLMTHKFGVSHELAGTITSILPFGTLIFTPLFGYVCDYKGQSASLMIYGSVLLVVVHLMFSLTTISPFIPMFILGVAFSLVPAAMWPGVAKIVEINKIGTAYGLMFTIQNLGLCAFPILIGVVLDRSNVGVAEAIAAGQDVVYDYTNPILMLAGLGLIGVVFALLLKQDDKTSGYGLELPNKMS